MNLLKSFLRLACFTIALSGISLRAQDAATADVPAATNAAPAAVEEAAAVSEATNAAPAVAAPARAVIEPKQAPASALTKATEESDAEVTVSSSEQSSQEIPPALLGILSIIYGGLALAFLIIFISMWKVFTKAGQPGWACIIPFYNIYVLCVISGKPAWFIILFFLPVANFIAAVLVNLSLARNFGKGAGFALGLVFLPVIFVPMLAFGNAQYLGPNGEAAPTAA